MTTDFRALAAELLVWAERTSAHYVVPPHVILRARAALAATEQGPTDEELHQFWLKNYVSMRPCWDIDIGPGDVAAIALAALARWGRPAVEPVPVRERLPGPEDCDAKGRCWLCGKVEGDWRLINSANSGVPHLKYCFSHWLPHWALPLPQEGADG